MTVCHHYGAAIEWDELGVPHLTHAYSFAAFPQSFLDGADPALLTVDSGRITVCGQAIYQIRDEHHRCAGSDDEKVLAELVAVLACP